MVLVFERGPHEKKAVAAVFWFDHPGVEIADVECSTSELTLAEDHAEDADEFAVVGESVAGVVLAGVGADFEERSPVGAREFVVETIEKLSMNFGEHAFTDGFDFGHQSSLKGIKNGTGNVVSRLGCW